MAEICSACLHPILKRWWGKERADCPECDRLADEGEDDTPCASPEPETVSVGFYNR